MKHENCCWLCVGFLCVYVHFVCFAEQNSVVLLSFDPIPITHYFRMTGKKLGENSFKLNVLAVHTYTNLFYIFIRPSVHDSMLNCCETSPNRIP